MKLRDSGLSREDVEEVYGLCYTAGQALEDANGAAPPKTIMDEDGVTPIANPDYVRYIRLNSLTQVFMLMCNQAMAFDMANFTVTNPCVIVTSQAGAY